MYIANDFRILFDCTMLVYDLQVKSNGGGIKTDQIISCTLFGCKWNTVSSSMLSIMTAITNCVLRRIFGTEQQKQNITL